MSEFKCPVCIHGKVRLKKEFHKTKHGLARHIFMEAAVGDGGKGNKSHQEWIEANVEEKNIKGVMKVLR